MRRKKELPGKVATKTIPVATFRDTSADRSGPDVPSIIETMEAARGDLLTEVRWRALVLPGVTETALYDGFCRHWTPAYYIGDRQLFHVHDFRGGLRATVFAGGKKLVPMILESDRIPHDLRLQLAKTSQSRGVKQVKVPIDSANDVTILLELARLKRESLH